MDQEKIGKFIAYKRHQKKMSQEELARKLRITNKAISKWENGRGMPDYSILNELCDNLDITIIELLNGEESSKDNQTVITEYLKYNDKKNLRKNLLFCLIIILIVAISILVIYFFNSFKKINIYELNGQSANFKYENGLLIKSNIKNLIEFGNLTSESISDDQIIEKTLAVKIKENYYLISNFKNSKIIMEKNGYSEYFSSEKLDNVPKNLYILIYYRVDDEVKLEELKINSELIMKNDKILYLKKDKITEDESIPINLNKYSNINVCEEHFINAGFNYNEAEHIFSGENTLDKKIQEKQYISFNCYNVDESFQYYYEKNGIIIKVVKVKKNNEDIQILFSIYNSQKKNGGYLSYNVKKQLISGDEDLMIYKQDIMNAIELYNKYKLK